MRCRRRGKEKSNLEIEKESRRQIISDLYDFLNDGKNVIFESTGNLWFLKDIFDIAKPFGIYCVRVEADRKERLRRLRKRGFEEYELGLLEEELLPYPPAHLVIRSPFTEKGLREFENKVLYYESYFKLVNNKSKLWSKEE